MAKMTVFHGSYIKVDNPKVINSKNTKDFGDGFYCTIYREQAIRLALRYDKSIVNTYTVSFRNKNNLKVLEFKEMTDEWLDFIVSCRSGKKHNYDIVIGAMADDQIYNYVSDFIDGAITREQFWSLAKFKYPTHQIVFCTNKAIQCLNFVTCEEVNYDWKGN